MKRIPLFVLVGPLVAWLTAFGLLTRTVEGPIFEEARYWLASFLACYAFSIPPLLVTAWIDRRVPRGRPLVCGLAGFAIAFVLYYIFMHEGGREEDIRIFHRHWFSVGLVWGLPAAVCSWLAGMMNQSKAA